MAGLLTHLGISVTGFLIIYFLFHESAIKQRWIYGLSFAIGHLLPDLLDFGVASISQRSLIPSHIIVNSLFYPLKIFGHNFTNWLIIALVVVGTLFLSYIFKKLSKRNFVMITIAIALLLAGIFLHVQLDAWIQEANHWI